MQSAAVDVALPVVLKTTGGLCRLKCCLAVDARRLSANLRAGVDLRSESSSCCSKTTGGLCRLKCCLAVDARRLSANLRAGVDLRSESSSCRLIMYARRLSSYLPPRRGCEAVVALPAALLPGGREAAATVVIPAASPWMRGGRRHTCCLDARMLQSSYLLLASLP